MIRPNSPIALQILFCGQPVVLRQVGVCYLVALDFFYLDVFGRVDFS